LKFQVFQLEIGLAQRHAQITQSTQNVQILDKNIQDHDQRLKRLEQLIKE
jgi:uncharacterized protein (DUF3084 family)